MAPATSLSKEENHAPPRGARRVHPIVHPITDIQSYSNVIWGYENDEQTITAREVAQSSVVRVVTTVVVVATAVIVVVTVVVVTRDVRSTVVIIIVASFFF